MSITRAMFRNQLVTIEPEIDDGSNLTITCPVNTPDYTEGLQQIVQSWQPQLTIEGQNSQVATHAEILNNQVVCSLTAESGELSESQLQNLAADLGRYLNHQGTRTMSASATGTTTGEEDFETMRGT